MAEVGKPKMEVPVYEPPAELAAEIEAYGAEQLKAALMDANKLEREENVARIKAEIADAFMENILTTQKTLLILPRNWLKRLSAAPFPWIKSARTDVRWTKCAL